MSESDFIITSSPSLIFFSSLCISICRFRISVCTKWRLPTFHSCWTSWEGCCRLRCPNRFPTSSRTCRVREKPPRSSSSSALKSLHTQLDFQNRRPHSDSRESPGKLPCRCKSLARRSGCSGLRKTWKYFWKFPFRWKFKLASSNFFQCTSLKFLN